MSILDTYAPAWYRAALPFYHCKGPLKDLGIEMVASQTLPQPDDFDAIIIHRALTNDHIANFFQQALYLGKQIIYGADDDVFNVPESNPAHATLMNPSIKGANQLLLASCSRMQVSTQPLGDSLSKRLRTPPPIDILPNLIDLSYWQDPWQKTDDTIRILYTCSVHHSEDLMLLPLVFEELLSSEPKVEVYFFGDYPETMSEWRRTPYTRQAIMHPHPRYNGRLKFIDGVPLLAYPTILRELRPDIGVCPLVDNAFNICKSALKWQELTCAGACVVASDVPSYSCIRDGIDGLKVGKKGWLPVLHDLVKQKKLRANLQAQARKRIAAEFSWSSPAKQLWVDSFRACVS